MKKLEFSFLPVRMRTIIIPILSGGKWKILFSTILMKQQTLLYYPNAIEFILGHVKQRFPALHYIGVNQFGQKDYARYEFLFRGNCYEQDGLLSLDVKAFILQYFNIQCVVTIEWHTSWGTHFNDSTTI
jgi:hypothetical protein